MLNKPPPLRPLPPDTAEWGAKVLKPDDRYRRIGDQLYPDTYARYAPAFIRLPAPVDFTPFDLALILILQHQERLSLERAAYYLRMHLGWKYALRLPLGHAGCTERDLTTFHRRLQAAKPALLPVMHSLTLGVRAVWNEV